MTHFLQPKATRSMSKRGDLDIGQAHPPPALKPTRLAC